MKDVFVRLLKVAEKAQNMDRELSKNGYSENIFADIFGDIADVIYKMLGENTATFENSLTYIVLNTDAISIDGKATLLSERFKERMPIT